jgi:hypothetical protein
LIRKADGYKDNAYPFGGMLINETAKLLNEIAAEKLYKSFVDKMITKGDELFASESLPFILEELKNTEISGRVMAEFDLDVINATPSLDTTLDDGDQIIIPIKSEQVYIYGEVNQSGAIRYKPSQNIDQYISNVGGFLETADNDNIFVVHPNGEVYRTNNLNKSFLLNSRNDDILVYPGSIIYVPRNVSQNPAVIASIWAPILTSSVTAITALSVLNNK